MKLPQFATLIFSYWILSEPTLGISMGSFHQSLFAADPAASSSQNSAKQLTRPRHRYRQLSFHKSSDIEATSLTRVDWSSKLQKLIDFTCEKDAILLRLRYEPKYSLLRASEIAEIQQAQVSVGVNSSRPECIADDLGTEDGRFELRIEHSECDTALGQEGDFLVHDNEDAQHQLNLFDSKRSQQSWSLPHAVELGQYVFIEATPAYHPSDFSKDSSIVPDVRSHPVDCWLSPSQHDVEPKKPFLQNGCPVLESTSNGRSVGLSMIYHLHDAPLRVAIRLGTYLLPSDDVHIAFAHCHIITCVQSHAKALYNIPSCPISHHCSVSRDWPNKTLLAPSSQPESLLRHAAAGPLQIKNPASREKCQKICREEGAKEGQVQGDRPAVPPPHSSQLVPTGMSTQTVSIIAFCCFVLGMLSTASIWVLHVKTNQKMSKTRAVNYQTPGPGPATLNQPLPTTRLMVDANER